MPDFNGVTLTITLDSGITEVQVQDIYEAWKDWLLEHPSRRGFPQAFRPDGGAPLTSIINQGSYFFLRNDLGWRVKPPEEDITVYLVGNLAVVDTAVEAIIPTIGAFTAAIIGLQPVTQGVTPVMAEQLAYGSFGDQVTLDVINGTALNGGDPSVFLIGTKEDPVNNAADARLIADARGFLKIGVRGNYTFTTGDDISGLTVEGENPTQSIIVCDPAAETTGSEFFECHLQGTLDGGATVRQCLLTSLDYVNGFIHECILSQGTITLSGSQPAYFLECKTGLGTPMIDHGGSGQALVMQNYSGNIDHKNKTGTDSADCLHLGGTVIVESTVTGGVINFTGTGDVINQADKARVVDKMLHGAKVDDIRQLVELLRPTHSSSGIVIYWAPFDGDDTLDGDHVDRAVSTFAQAHSMAVSGRHDVIVCVSNDPAGITITNEEIVISKNDVYLRGTGRDFRIVGDNDLVDVVHITGDNCEISGLALSSNASSTAHQLHLDGVKNTLVKDMWVFEGGSGVLLTDTEDCTFSNARIAHNTGNGMEIQGISEHTAIENCHISSNTGTGILMSTSGHEISVTNGTILHSNGAYGIDIEAGSNGIHILGGVIMYGNALGDTRVDPSVTDTYNVSNVGFKTLQIHGQVDRSVHIDTELSAVGDGFQQTPFSDFSDAVDDAELHNLLRLHVISDATVDRQLKNFEVFGAGLPTIDLNGQNMNNSIFRTCGLTGSHTGVMQAIQCAVDGLSGMAGVFYTVSINGTIAAAAGAPGLLLWETAPAIAGQPWSIDMGAAGDVVVAVQNSTAGVTVLNMNSAGDVFHFHGFQGLLTIDSSCTAGTIVATGGVRVVDNSAGTTVNLTQLESIVTATEVWSSTEGAQIISDTSFIKDIEGGRWKLDTTLNQMIFYKDDNVTEIARFDTTNAAGSPAVTDVRERVRV